MELEEHIATTIVHLSTSSAYKKLGSRYAIGSNRDWVVDQQADKKLRAKKRALPKKALDLLLSHHNLLLELCWRHINTQEIKNLYPFTMKKRPIVFGCNSPTLWYLRHILCPPMKLVRPTSFLNGLQIFRSGRWRLHRWGLGTLWKFLANSYILFMIDVINIQLWTCNVMIFQQISCAFIHWG